jgi:hypothetical protein
VMAPGRPTAPPYGTRCDHLPMTWIWIFVP